MEIIVGAMFMILGGLELIGNGINLPYRDWSYGAGIVSTVFYPKWDLIGALVMHASLFAIGMMLIGSQMDRLRFPGLPLFIILLIYFTVVSLVRVAAPIRWAEPFGAPFERPLGGENILTVAQRAITSGIGGLVGWFIAELTGKLLLGIFSKNLGESTSENEAILSDFRNWKWHWVILHALAGSMFGWQAILLVGLVSAVLVLLGDQFLTNKRITIKQSPEHEPQEDAAEDTKEDPTESTLPEEIPKVIKPAEGLFSRPVLALAIWIITLFLHLCFWRWIAVAWHFT